MKGTVHKFLQDIIVKALRDNGWNAQKEYLVYDEGRWDIFAKKRGEEIKIEIMDTNIPTWFLFRVLGSKIHDGKRSLRGTYHVYREKTRS